MHHISPLLSDACRICNSDRETLDHLFWECTEVRHFWGRVFQLLQLLAPGCQVPGPELVHIVNPFSILPKATFPVVVSIYGTALWSLWKMYLGMVFEGRIFSSVALNEQFAFSVTSHIQLLFSVACKKKKLASFKKLWCRSHCINICGSKVSLDISL